MSDLVKPVTRYRLKVVTKVVATISAHVTVTDAEVREWADIDGTEEVDPELLEEYVMETTDESLFEMDQIDEWLPLGARTELTILSAEKVMTAPAAFVPLSGMEGL